MSANTIIKFIDLQLRARKAKCKVEVIGVVSFSGSSLSRSVMYGVGPVSIRNLESHINSHINNDKAVDDKKVFAYDTIKEVEAHLNAVEFCVKMAAN